MNAGTGESPADHLAGIDKIVLQVETISDWAEETDAAAEWAQGVANTTHAPDVVVGTLMDAIDCPALRVVVGASKTQLGERIALVETEVLESVDVIRTGRGALCATWKEAQMEDIDAIDREALIAALDRGWSMFLAAWKRAPAELAAFEAKVRGGPIDLYSPSEN